MSPNADGVVPKSYLLRLCLQPLTTVVWLKHWLIYRIKHKTIHQLIESLKKEPGSPVPWDLGLGVCLFMVSFKGESNFSPLVTRKGSSGLACNWPRSKLDLHLTN